LGQRLLVEEGGNQLVGCAVEDLIDQLTGLTDLHLCPRNEGMAHKPGFGALDGTLADTPLDEGIGGIDIPSHLLAQDIGDGFGRQVALAPQHIHNTDLGIL